MSLVAKKWYADARPNENGLYVEILARKPGVVAWLFTLTGIDDTHYPGVFFDKIIIQSCRIFLRSELRPSKSIRARKIFSDYV